MEIGGKEGRVVPESVMEAVKRTSTNIEEFRSHFLQFLSLCDPQVLGEMPPLSRAKSLLLLAKATTTLFTYPIPLDCYSKSYLIATRTRTQQRSHRIALSLDDLTSEVRLRCNGVHPDDHAVKSELDRLSLYQDKLEQFIDLSKAPLRPSTTLNTQAATRFIEHSLPDLTPEQRQSLRDISKGEGPKIKYVERSVHKKRKYQPGENKSVRTAAQEFLEKAARELLGDNKSGFKGPVLPEASIEDDLSME